jgi:hypothetical protein
LIRTLVTTALLLGTAQAMAPASAPAMLAQETREACEESGGWWEFHFQACIHLDEGSAVATEGATELLPAMTAAAGTVASVTEGAPMVGRSVRAS